MTRFRLNLAVAASVLALCGSAAAQPAQAPAMTTLQAPVLPAPVAVKLDPAKTAILLLDVVQPICGVQPKCSGPILTALVPFLAKARKAGVTVAYGTVGRNMGLWMAGVTPTANDIKIAITGQDRFYDTDLDAQLKAKGITTLILAGWKVSGSVTYTSVGATLRGYTVVVPQDTTISPTDFETEIGYYQILNQLSANATNIPLKPKATTVSRTDLIGFQ